MEDIKDYLEQTNTVLLTKDAFKYLKDCADIITKIINGVSREDLGFPVSAEFYNSVEAVNHQETVTEFADRCQECGVEYGKLLKQEPDPCDFCSIIYPDADTKDIVFRRGKYSDVNIDSFITIDNEGKHHANIDPGDPYELGYLVDIKFCPYCGRKLAESEKTCQN